MRTCFLVISLIVFSQTVFSQKLFFAKSNYTDSIAFENNIPALALQAIDKYREPDKATYYDNLFRLLVVAKEYDGVGPMLNYLTWISYGDSLPNKALGFAYKMYAAALATHPGDNNQFSLAYQARFNEAFYILDGDGQNWAAQYFDNDLADMKSALDKKLHNPDNTDSITVTDAVRLCRSYCTFKTYFVTQPLAKTLLAKIEKEKYIRDDSVLVKMPDGAMISLTIIRDKKINTPQPVVLMYNIYAGQDPAICKEAVQRGYTGIVANTRGKRLSPDAIEPFEHDAKDAYYIIDWISKQSWCNGKIGMYGGSYLGFSQWSAVKYLHPALKTIVPQVAVGIGIDYPSHNGIFMSYMLRWLHYVMDNKLTNNADFGDSKKWKKTNYDWFRKGASFRSLDTLEGRPNYIFQRWLQHPGYDNYWQAMTPQKNEFAKINIPIFTTTGYWDDDQVGAMYYYRQYFKWNKNPNYYLLIGPYDHGGAQGYPSREMRGYTIDSVANVTIEDIVFKWFDYTLKDSSRPAILKDKVNFEVMGANKWQHVASLDKMHNDTLTLYLGNTLTGRQYPLLAARPSTRAYIAQQVDLADRSDTRFNPDSTTPGGMLVDTALYPEKQQLVFASQPIDKPFAISGSLAASLMASINKKDMDIDLKLYEQTPDGKFLSLTENLQRASYARDKTKRQLLVPGKIETIRLNSTYITSRQLQKGSRIVIVMGINRNPGWQINYGTGKDVSDETIKDAGVPVSIKWYNSSCIKLPVLR